MNLSTKLELVSLAEIDLQEVEWLWYPYIPFGKITIIQGDPGEGQTTLGLQLASACSNGHGFPGMVCVEVRCSDSSGQQLISVKIC